MTLEAYVVHAIDSLDSRIDSWLDLMAHDPGETWTEQTKLYERHLWKGPAPTARGRSPIEGRGRRVEKRKRQRGGAPATPPPAPAAPRLSFKPLEALTGEPVPPAPPGAPSESGETPVPERPPES
jgi:3'-5' exoribonuclease